MIAASPARATCSDLWWNTATQINVRANRIKSTGIPNTQTGRAAAAVCAAAGDAASRRLAMLTPDMRASARHRTCAIWRLQSVIAQQVLLQDGRFTGPPLRQHAIR